MAPTEEMTEDRSAHDVLAWGRVVVDPALREAVDTLPGAMRLISGYHFGWWDEKGRPTVTNGGKALRPTLVLLAAGAAGGAHTAALPAAVAVELVHNFSLLHDDVMDGDLTRRHRPTAWSVFGTNAAILVGDALLTLAFDVVAGGRHSAAQAGTRMLSAAVQNLVEGQCSDMAFEGRTSVGLAECLSMAEGKTGALLGCACALGASFGDGNAEQIGHLRAFGEQLGVAFQLVDDLLGIWGDPAVTGKPVHTDLHNRKKSLPVVAALGSGTTAGAELAALYGRERPLSDTEVVHAAELIGLAGGRAWSQNHADHLLAEALGRLRAARPAERAAAELEEVARLIARRDR